RRHPVPGHMGARVAVQQQHGRPRPAVADPQHRLAHVDPLQGEAVEHRAAPPQGTERALTRNSDGLAPSPSSRPQLTMRVGRMRRNSSAKLGKRGLMALPPLVRASARPRTSMARARRGSRRTSSSRKVTLGLRRASRHFLVLPKSTPPTSIASSSALKVKVSGTTWGWPSGPTVARRASPWLLRYSISVGVKALIVAPLVRVARAYRAGPGAARGERLRWAGRCESSWSTG